MSAVDVLIIGGGPAGLGAASKLAGHEGVNWLLCEQSNGLGGISRSVVDDAGYTWDIGGHVLFSHYDVLDRALDRALGTDGFFEHTREAWVLSGSTWVPYPFQNNLHRLPAATRQRCKDGLARAIATASGGRVPPADFGEFLLATFGEGITESFMRPYNEKVWAHPLHDMSYSWIAERVAVPDPNRVTDADSAEDDEVDWGPNSTFRFPRSGGTGAIWNALGDLLPRDRIALGTRLTAIDRHAKQARFDDGSVLGYEWLITTAPLDVTADMTGDPQLSELGSSLSHSSVHVVGLGVDSAVSDRLGTRSWMYFPSPSVPFFRVTNFSRYSPAHVPSGAPGGSLLIEVSESAHREVDPASLLDDVARALVDVGLLDDLGQVSHSWTHREEHAYPTPTLGRDQALRSLSADLESHDILSRGRFGSWCYEIGNMDHSFMQGYEAACRVLTGQTEPTFSSSGPFTSLARPQGSGMLR